MIIHRPETHPYVHFAIFGHDNSTTTTTTNNNNNKSNNENSKIEIME